MSRVDRLRAILTKVTRVPAERIQLDTDLRADLHVDSIQGLQMVAEIEEAFGVRIPDDRIDDYSDVRSVLELIEDAGG
ncbi:MAG: acyl carrier protein [Alphaproteobacteria bacterium]|nr:acyl carrier protein [Alphaproteobacteria bacterium]